MTAKILSMLLLITELSWAQKNEPIAADRPDQTETPAIVPRGMFQVEAGFAFQKTASQSHTFSLPTALWKYGVNENFELRLITEFVAETIDKESISGFTPILVGFKVKLCEENNIFPKTSFIGHISLSKAASKNYKTDYNAPEFRFTMQHTLTEKISLGYNLGCEWDGFSPSPTYIYTLTTGYSFTETFSSYVELFGYAPNNDSANHNFDGGITYLITDNFMVDLSSGVGLTDNAPQHYVAIGFSFRQ